MQRLPVVLHVVYKHDWSSAFLPGWACVHLPTMTPRVKLPHTLVSVLHWLWYCRATALSALANLTLLLGKNTLPFPAFGNLNFVSPPHRRAYTSMPKSCTNITFTHQQDFSKKNRFSYKICSHKNRPKGGGIASSSFILFFYLLYWYSYIVYFVCAPASEFGAMGSTSSLGFSYPNLFLVFLNLLFFRNL